MNVFLGLIITLFLLLEPKGLMHRWNILKTNYRLSAVSPLSPARHSESQSPAPFPHHHHNWRQACNAIPFSNSRPPWPLVCC